MNPFVNFNKRRVQLPKGCTDLTDVLRAKKCQYCDDIAVATVGWPDDYRWCEACQRDLEYFARQQDYSAVHVGFKEEAAIAGGLRSGERSAHSRGTEYGASRQRCPTIERLRDLRQFGVVEFARLGLHFGQLQPLSSLASSVFCAR